jgi:hypothetical protein
LMMMLCTGIDYRITDWRRPEKEPKALTDTGSCWFINEACASLG